MAERSRFEPTGAARALDRGVGRIHVLVHQVVSSLGGDVLSDTEFGIFTPLRTV